MLSTDEIKEQAMRFIKVFNQGDAEALDELIADDYVQHSPGVPPSREALSQFISATFTAFPDGRFDVEDIIAENDKVLLRWIFYGTHTGRWLNTPGKPSGKKISFSGMDLWRYDEDGKLAETWFIADTLGLMRQLGRQNLASYT